VTPSGEQAGSSGNSARVLNDLLNNTLDPGYAHAAGGPHKKHWWDGPIVWVACVAVGLVLTMAYQQSHRSAPARDAARKDLVSRIHTAQTRASNLDQQARDLSMEVNALRNRQLGSADGSQVRQLDIVSGGVAVKGPGVVVELSEPSAEQSTGPTGRSGTGSQQEVAVLHDRDIRAVVNELWSAGAEAISVNDIRLTATSAIRFAGESILVDFQTIVSPYTISAIGNRDSLLVDFADSEIARQLKTTQAVRGIGFKFSSKSEITEPSVTLNQQQYAQPGAALSAPNPSAAKPSDSAHQKQPNTSPTVSATPTSTETRP
jgi:uncharacterized protein YlxW (UPF0749 family)